MSKHDGNGIQSNDQTIMHDTWFLEAWQKIAGAAKVKRYLTRIGETSKEAREELYEMLGVDDVATQPREVTVDQLRAYRKRRETRHGEEQQVRHAAAE